MTHGCVCMLRPTYILPSHRVIFLVDCPTSRVKVVAEHIDKIHEVVNAAKLEKFSIAVMCGARLDYTSAVKDKLEQVFPQSQAYISLITGWFGEQWAVAIASFSHQLNRIGNAQSKPCPLTGTINFANTDTCLFTQCRRW